MAETLYQLSQDLQIAIEGCYKVDEETGEILVDPSMMDELQVRMADKVQAVMAYAAGRETLAKARRDAAKAMSASAKSLEAESQRWRDYAMSCMEAAGVRKLEGDMLTVSIRKCPVSVQVLDEGAVPDEYVTVKVTRSVDKQAVKEALKAGEDVPGCALVQNERVDVR